MSKKQWKFIALWGLEGAKHTFCCLILVCNQVKSDRNQQKIGAVEVQLAVPGTCGISTLMNLKVSVTTAANQFPPALVIMVPPELVEDRCTWQVLGIMRSSLPVDFQPPGLHLAAAQPM